jgi:hypothetical protein
MDRPSVPIKRSRQLRDISHQHHDILLFVWKIRQGIIYDIAPPRIAQYCEWFWNNTLKANQEEEEKIFLNFFSREDVLMNNLLEDHDAIRTKMQEVISGPSHYNLKRLAEILYYHVRFEERTFLPHVEYALSEEQLNAVEKMLHGYPVKKSATWSDEFWTRKNYAVAI